MRAAKTQTAGEVLDMKFDICQNCRNYYSALISLDVRKILCDRCKGIDSNFDPLRKDERLKLQEVK